MYLLLLEFQVLKYTTQGHNLEFIIGGDTVLGSQLN